MIVDDQLLTPSFVSLRSRGGEAFIFCPFSSKRGERIRMRFLRPSPDVELLLVLLQDCKLLSFFLALFLLASRERRICAKGGSDKGTVGGVSYICCTILPHPQCLSFTHLCIFFAAFPACFYSPIFDTRLKRKAR